MKQSKNEWGVVCEKCGWEGLAHELISNHLEDNCPHCHSNKIEWKGEDEEKGFEALYKELAYLEKQRNEAHQKEITALNNKLQFKEAQAKDLKQHLERMIKQVSRQDDLIVSLESAVAQRGMAIDHFKTKIAAALSFIHERKEGNAIQILNHLL